MALSGVETQITGRTEGDQTKWKDLVKWAYKNESDLAYCTFALFFFTTYTYF